MMAQTTESETMSLRANLSQVVHSILARARPPMMAPEVGVNRFTTPFSVDGEDTGETAEPQPDAELSEMVDAIYNVQPVDLMGMETVAIPEVEGIRKDRPK